MGPNVNLLLTHKPNSGTRPTLRGTALAATGMVVVADRGFLKRLWFRRAAPYVASNRATVLSQVGDETFDRFAALVAVTCAARQS
jgi:hypothetical protein